MEERRKFERFKLNVPTKIEVPTKKDRENKIALETDNLSAGGIFLKKSAPSFTEGVPVKVEIFLHFDELKTSEDPEGTLIISASGVIQRSNQDGTAIALNDDYDILTQMDLSQTIK
ncbi:MAG: PilZ domain-containing protein [Deltaproteobacteria bacterium]|nr:PilZ domain-containing protein [Deltaproteobacteria bacterium]